MNPIFLESKNLQETKSLFNQSAMDQSWNPRKIESPFLQMIQNLDASTEAKELSSMNSSFGSGFSFGGPTEWNSLSSDQSSFQPINRENEKVLTGLQKEENNIQEENPLNDDLSSRKIEENSERNDDEEVNENEEEREEDEVAIQNNTIDKLNIFSMFSSIGNLVSDKSNRANDSESNSGKNSNQEQTSKTKEKINNHEIVSGKKGDLEKFEKKVLTTQDIWEKLVDKTDKKSVLSGEEQADSSNSKNSNKKEIKIIKSEIHESQRSPEVKKVASEDSNIKNKEATDAEKKEFLTINKTGKNSRVENPENKETIKQPDKSDSSNLKNDSQENVSVKKFLEKDERAEIRREVSKWDIQKEKVRMESKSGSDTVQSNSANKEGVSGINNSSSSQSSDSGKDQHSNAMRNEFINSLNSKSKSSEAPQSSALTKEEMKANFEKLVQTAKIQIINQGKSQAEIHMNPKDLGRMILKISVNQDKVEGRIMVDSEIVKSAIQADLSQLKEDLKGQGLVLESLQIDVDLDHENDLAQKREGYAWEKGKNKESELDQKLEANQNIIYTRENSLLDVVA